MKINGLRWVILGLILMVTIINILDRGTLNYMWQDERDKATGVVIRHGIASELGIVNDGMTPEVRQTKGKQVLSWVNIYFMLAYGLSQIVSGKVYDKIGTRKGFIVSALIWGGAVTLTSFVNGLYSLVTLGIIIGLGEAGPWPGTTKSNAEWFPIKERAMAQGLFGASASVGNILLPIIIPFLFLPAGWRITYFVMGFICVLWIIPWYFINKDSPKKHPWITPKEQDYIMKGQPLEVNKEEPAWKTCQLLADKRSYSVIATRFFLDPIWWMFMTWLPIYLQEVYKLNLKSVSAVAWIPFVGAALGGISGGLVSGKLIAKGIPAIRARKIAITIGGALIIPGMIGAAFAPTALFATLMLMFILFGFQFAITNIQTLPSDYHSGKNVGSLAGIGGAAAVLGIVISTYLVPALTKGGNWIPFFAMGLTLVPLSIISVYVFTPKQEKG